jgi:23S rRNA-/tRNA-specific pseudouridylate synthase
VRRWLLASHRDLFVLNKPAGLVVQGPHAQSLDALIRTALRHAQLPCSDAATPSSMTARRQWWALAG